MIESLGAVTLATADMQRAVAFYEALGFELHSGGRDRDFSNFRIGGVSLNLALRPAYRGGAPWGRLVFYVDDVDAVYEAVLAAGLVPVAPPRDAEWHERYFHILDPDGHELSFARRLA